MPNVNGKELISAAKCLSICCDAQANPDKEIDPKKDPVLSPLFLVLSKLFLLPNQYKVIIEFLKSETDLPSDFSLTSPKFKDDLDNDLLAQFIQSQPQKLPIKHGFSTEPPKIIDDIKPYLPNENGILNKKIELSLNMQFLTLCDVKTMIDLYCQQEGFYFSIMRHDKGSKTHHTGSLKYRCSNWRRKSKDNNNNNNIDNNNNNNNNNLQIKDHINSKNDLKNIEQINDEQEDGQLTHYKQNDHQIYQKQLKLQGIQYQQLNLQQSQFEHLPKHSELNHQELQHFQINQHLNSPTKKIRNKQKPRKLNPNYTDCQAEIHFTIYKHPILKFVLTYLNLNHNHSIENVRKRARIQFQV